MKFPVKLLIVLVTVAAACALVYAAGAAAGSDTRLERITEATACPATGCASGTCHNLDAVPEPDGIAEMACPETACTSVECHAWDTLAGRYHTASNASLVVWFLVPTALVIVVVLAAKKVR